MVKGTSSPDLFLKMKENNEDPTLALLLFTMGLIAGIIIGGML